MDIKVGQIVSYKNYAKLDYLEEGKVTRILEVTDSIYKQDVGDKFAYIQVDDFSIATLVRFEDIVKVGE